LKTKLFIQLATVIVALAIAGMLNGCNPVDYFRQAQIYTDGSAYVGYGAYYNQIIIGAVKTSGGYITGNADMQVTTTDLQALRALVAEKQMVRTTWDALPPEVKAFIMVSAARYFPLMPYDADPCKRILDRQCPG
jgi:hypothetical protein